MCINNNLLTEMVGFVSNFNISYGVRLYKTIIITYKLSCSVMESVLPDKIELVYKNAAVDYIAKVRPILILLDTSKFFHGRVSLERSLGQKTYCVLMSF